MLPDAKRFHIPAMYERTETREPIDLRPGWVAVSEEDYKLALDRINDLETQLAANLDGRAWRMVRRLEERVCHQRAEIKRLHGRLSALAHADSFHTARVALASYERETTPAVLFYKRFCARLINGRLLGAMLGLIDTVEKGRDA